MNKKLLGLVLSLVVLSLVACGNKTAQAPANSSEAPVQVVTVAASPVPHAELLNQVKDDMKALGYDLQVREFSDYVLPNLAVDQGEIMANFFQHQPYLDDFNAERGTKVVTVGKIHYEPFGVYAGSKKSLELASGDKIAVPNDVTNEARSLNLLEAAGVIKLKEGTGLTATKLDIVENPYNVEIVELESAQIPRSLDSVAVACMNGNYAMEAGFKVSDALFVEPQSSTAAQTYANILCVKSGNENEKWAKDLLNCLKSKKVKDYIEKTYNKSVIAID
jgi:D-methionine transport system substrate-binding protein